MGIKIKQIDLPPGATTTAVTDGQTLTGTEAAELIAGVDSTNAAQFIATETDGRVQVSDAGDSLTVDSPQLPDTLVGGRLNTNLGSWFGSTTPTIGQKPMTGSLPVTMASDQVLTVQGDPAGEPLRISIPSVSDAGNSSSTPLGSNATFTGTGVYVRDFATIAVHAYANVGSATNGLKLQWSTDNVFWDETLEFNVLPSLAGSYTVGPRADYFRLTYTNGGTAQTTFHIQTNLHYSLIRTGTVRISDTINGELDASVVKAVITGKTTGGGGGYVDVKVTPSGAVAIDGTVTANINATGGLALDTTLTGGTQLTQITDGVNSAAIKPGLTPADGSEPALVVVVSPINTLNVVGEVNSVIYDQVNAERAVVKPPSTPAVGTDAALVVALSPNSATIDVNVVSGGSGGGGGAGTEYADGAARGTATGTLLMLDDGTNIQSASADTAGRQNVNSRVTDGTSTAAVKAASTAAVAADPALVVAVSPNSTLVTQEIRTATGTVTGLSVSNASSTTLLAANANRKGATVMNDSTPASLLVKFGASASVSSYSVLMLAGAYLEVPYGYTGIITAIATAANANARMTEFT